MSDSYYDAVVVGSGFGGAIVASRLAAAGLSVCVFERGQEYPPGSFPRSPAQVRKNFWEPREGLQGLVDIWSFSGIDAVVASGVGGGSLIYSNVLIRKDEAWFVDEGERWPVSRQDLDPHYDAVEKVLRCQPYPYKHAPYSDTPKMHALRAAARAIGRDVQYPELGVAFGQPGQKPRPGVPLSDPDGHNMYGVPRYSCRLCGECNIGCNYGSKHTIDLTYLSLAKRDGAVIKPRCEVREFTPVATPRGYRVLYVEHPPALEGTPYRRIDLSVHTATCRYLILCAGTFGTTFLLLRMKRERREFGDLSPSLGTRFSGNGDMLSVILRSRVRTTAGELQPRVIAPNFGPVITSAIRIPDALDSGGPGRDDERGFYVEDSGFPAILSWLGETVPTASRLSRLLRLTWRYLCRRLGFESSTKLSAAVADFLGDGVLSDSTLPIFIMGRDVPNGVMSITDDSRLDVDWDLSRSRPYVDRARKCARRISDVLRGEYVDNPMWHLRRFITVHPLGGAPMANDAKSGVADSYGRVFGYPGLYVADGSLVPGPVGPNPALTIAAIADRVACQLLEDHDGSR